MVPLKCVGFEQLDSLEHVANTAAIFISAVSRRFAFLSRVLNKRGGNRESVNKEMAGLCIHD
jgi:hypothetical protein